MSRIAFVFPGQGAQYVGMGREFVDNFPVSKRVFQEAGDSLSKDVEKLCFEGPDDELIKTENTQPAILTTSIAILKAIESEGIDCEYTAGLSLGEYAALVKAKTFEFADAVKVVRNRGKYMQEAVPMGVGTMAAVLGIERDELKNALEECKEYGIVEVANFNSPGQIVISGEVEAVKVAVEKAIRKGAKKALLLPVSAPFHSSLLAPAGYKLQADLERINISSPQKSIVSNVDAKVIKSNSEVIPSLVKQVSSSVLWEESVELMMNEGVDTFLEIGPGKSLTGFIKRIGKTLSKDIRVFNIEDIASFNNAISQLS